MIIINIIITVDHERRFIDPRQAMFCLVVLGLIMFVIISNKSFQTLLVELKSNALICQVRIILVI